jgi:hypothetical protein
MATTYYFLEARSERGDPIAQEIAIPASYDQFDFGKKLPHLKKPIRVTISKPKQRLTDLIQGPFTYVIASDQLRDLFLELDPANIQVEPVDLYYESRKVVRHHFVQVLNNIDAIDWSSSKLQSYPEDKYSIVNVSKLVLDQRAIGKRNVFRIEGLNARLVVSSVFRDRVVKQQLTGMEFTPTKNFKLA